MFIIIKAAGRFPVSKQKAEEKEEMAKKLITVLLTLTLIAGSTISIYAAEQPAAANTEYHYRSEDSGTACR